jgi:hypothetical protein
VDAAPRGDGAAGPEQGVTGTVAPIYPGVTETALERVLRLVGTARQTVPVRSYQRVERGRLQAVRQHVQGHAVGQHVEQAGALKAGNVIQVGLGQYTVTAVKPYVRKAAAAKPNTAGTTSAGKGVSTGAPKSTASAGKGVSTGAPKSTASAGKGVSTAADPQVILDAAAKAQKVPSNALEVELTLQQAGVKGSRGVLVPRTLKVVVLR